MAAAVDQYSFHTPGIDQALISAGEYPFGPSVPGSEFVDKSWSTMDESSLPENFGFDPPNTELEQGQRFSMMDFQHPDPLPASLTPPELAAEYEAYRPPQPQPIDTSHSFEHTRFQHGQVTPPDDEFPPDAKFPLVDQVVDMPIKQEAADPLPIASLPKRKRSSGSDESQSGPKRRRSRKAIVPPMPEDESLEPVEDEKRNKFLERNRVAASKCRQKKKEWTQNLESQARELQAAKTQMSILVTSLKDEVMWLKGEMLKHTDCGCHHIREYLSREAESIALGGGRTPPVHSPIERPSSTSHSSPDDNSGESVASWTGDECMNFSGPGTGAPGAPITTGVQSDKGDMSPTGRIGVNKSISSSGT